MPAGVEPRESPTLTRISALSLQILVFGFAIAIVANITSAWIGEQTWRIQLSIIALVSWIGGWSFVVLIRRGLTERKTAGFAVPMDYRARKVIATLDLSDWEQNGLRARSLNWGGGIMSVSFGFEKLRRDGHLPPNEDWDNLIPALLDSLEYATMEFFKRYYMLGWAIVDEASATPGHATHSWAQAAGTSVTLDSLPESLRNNPIYQNQERNEHGTFVGTSPPRFTLPGGMRVRHESPTDEGIWRRIIFKSRYSSLTLHFSANGGQVAGDAVQQDRFSLFFFNMVALISSPWWSAFSRRARQERYWAEDVVARLSDYLSLNS